MADINSYSTLEACIIGADLGQANDYTAINYMDVRKNVEEHSDGTANVDYAFNVLHLEKLELGMPYPRQAAYLAQLTRAVGMSGRKPHLVVDASGVGRPVVDELKRHGLAPIAVTITGGKQELEGGDFRFSVPKRNLVSNLVIALQTERLKVTDSLPYTKAFREEVINFKSKITSSGNETFEADRSTHDDLVMSVALSTWWAMKRRWAGTQYSRVDLFSR